MRFFGTSTQLRFTAPGTSRGTVSVSVTPARLLVDASAVSAVFCLLCSASPSPLFFSWKQVGDDVCGAKGVGPSGQTGEVLAAVRRR